MTFTNSYFECYEAEDYWFQDNGTQANWALVNDTTANNDGSICANGSITSGYSPASGVTHHLINPYPLGSEVWLRAMGPGQLLYINADDNNNPIAVGLVAGWQWIKLPITLNVVHAKFKLVTQTPGVCVDKVIITDATETPTGEEGFTNQQVTCDIQVNQTGPAVSGTTQNIPQGQQVIVGINDTNYSAIVDANGDWSLTVGATDAAAANGLSIVAFVDSGTGCTDTASFVFTDSGSNNTGSGGTGSTTESFFEKLEMEDSEWLQSINGNWNILNDDPLASGSYINASTGSPVAHKSFFAITNSDPYNAWIRVKGIGSLDYAWADDPVSGGIPVNSASFVWVQIPGDVPQFVSKIRIIRTTGDICVDNVVITCDLVTPPSGQCGYTTTQGSGGSGSSGGVGDGGQGGSSETSDQNADDSTLCIHTNPNTVINVIPYEPNQHA